MKKISVFAILLASLCLSLTVQSQVTITDKGNYIEFSNGYCTFLCK